MSQPLIILLDDAEDIDLTVTALRARAKQLSAAAANAAGETATLRRTKADYRQQALAITRMLEEAARLERVATLIEAGARLDPMPELYAESPTEPAAADDQFDDVTAEEEPDPDPLDPEANIPDAVEVFTVEDAAPDPAPRPALRRRTPVTPAPVPAPVPAAAAAEDPYEDVDKTKVPADAGQVTAARIRAAKTTGRLAVLPPLPAEDADGVTIGDE